jgi:hypothetical protein
MDNLKKESTPSEKAALLELEDICEQCISIIRKAISITCQKQDTEVLPQKMKLAENQIAEAILSLHPIIDGNEIADLLSSEGTTPQDGITKLARWLTKKALINADTNTSAALETWHTSLDEELEAWIDNPEPTALTAIIENYSVYFRGSSGTAYVYVKFSDLLDTHCNSKKQYEYRKLFYQIIKKLSIPLDSRELIKLEEYLHGANIPQQIALPFTTDTTEEKSPQPKSKPQQTPASSN